MTSPVFHLRFTAQRMYANWAKATPLHKLATVLYFVALVALAYFAGAVVAVAWIVPH